MGRGRLIGPPAAGLGAGWSRHAAKDNCVTRRGCPFNPNKSELACAFCELSSGSCVIGGDPDSAGGVARNHRRRSGRPVEAPGGVTSVAITGFARSGGLVKPFRRRTFRFKKCSRVGARASGIPAFRNPRSRPGWHPREAGRASHLRSRRPASSCAGSFGSPRPGQRPIRPGAGADCSPAS